MVSSVKRRHRPTRHDDRVFLQQVLELVGGIGGARRNRTDDLFNAIEALSQLSYGPIFQECGAAASIGRSAITSRGRRYSRKRPPATRPSGEKTTPVEGAGAPAPAESGGQSAFLVRSDVAVDEGGDVVVVFFFLFEEGVFLRVGALIFPIDVADNRLGCFLLACL